MLQFLKKIPIHWKIIIALFFGVIFGIIFQVDKYSVKITHLEGTNKITSEIKNWDSFIFYDSDRNNIVKEFGKEDQTLILKYFKDKSKKSFGCIIKINQKELAFNNIISVEKVKTIATHIKFFGNIFIRLLSFVAIPLVLASLIVGAGSLGEIKTLGKIGIVTFSFYIVTTAVAIVVGLIYANILRPGEKLLAANKEQLLQTYLSESQARINVQDIGFDIFSFIENIVPTNPINALAKGEMLQIVFFAVMIGIVINFLDKKYSEPVLNFFAGFSQIMIKMVTLVMIIAPIGVFSLISAMIAEFGGGIIYTLFWYVLTVLLGLLTLLIMLYPFIVWYFGKMSPIKFYKGMRSAMAVAFSTSSSAATLPINFDCVENKLGVPNKIAGFVLPLGATINMDGTALYQGVATLFIAQVYGIQLDWVMQLTIVFTAVMASIGTAPVPGVGIIMLVMILNSVNVPVEGIAIIIGVDRLLDMCRTVPNIVGDAAVSVSVWNIFKNKI